tara:strand:- start:1078 stop:2040 length:963 start_codon:yes stop_codon:yes gene_type:complete
MKILVTGSSGFIGYHLSKSLLDDGNVICGIDNMNNYYDIRLKKERLKNLKKYNNFKFHEINLINSNALKSIFKKFSPEIVVNLGAQAGVRHSINNPMDYLDSNLIGFVNVLDNCKRSNVRGLIYASSSSVYGSNTKIPFDVDDKTDNPVSMYAATKKSNELLANSYSHIHNLNVTGLRFFTVYGPWGRPDMAYFSFTNNIIDGKPINVFNEGKMQRDFTYIDDIIEGTKTAIKKNYRCEIFNLGNNKPVKLMDFISILEKEIGIKAQIKFQPMQRGDVKTTFANIDYSEKKLNYEPKTSIEKGLKNFISWYKSYYSLKIN